MLKTRFYLNDQCCYSNLAKILNLSLITFLKLHCFYLLLWDCCWVLWMMEMKLDVVSVVNDIVLAVEYVVP